MVVSEGYAWISILALLARELIALPSPTSVVLSAKWSDNMKLYPSNCPLLNSWNNGLT